jgi:hypothetical protein
MDALLGVTIVHFPSVAPGRDVLTAFRRHECEFWWGVYDDQFAGGSPSGAFVDDH